MELNKRDIRKNIINKRDMVVSEKRQEWDSDIFDSVINSDFYKNAKVIFAFVSFGSEVDTKRFIKQAIKDNKIIGVPKVKSKAEGFVIHEINSLEDLEEGFYGILEPKNSCRILEDDSFDFILMPGVAFDRFGGRIGYGGGFYDRFLSNLKRNVPKIAIAYDLQIIEKIPMSDHDIRIDGIITENETILFSCEF